MKVPYNKFTGIHFLSLAISSLLINDRHSGTEEVSESTKRRMDGEKTEFIPPPEPKDVPLEDIEKWEKSHPGLTLKIRPHNSTKDVFDSSMTRLRRDNDQRFSHPGMKKPPRMWQPDNRVPFRPKQEGLHVPLKKTKSPYR